MFDRVYVKDVSRLARNVVDFLQSVRKLKLLNIDCQFITTNMSSSDGELTLTILAAVAQEESANLSKRVKFGKAKNAENGKVPNLVYGYDKENGNYFDLKINTFEADIVRRIFDLYLNSSYGLNPIAKTLNKECIKTKRNCKWSKNAICRILRNQIYIGKVINGKEKIEDFLTGKRVKMNNEDLKEVYKPELAIINVDDFERVQDILKVRGELFKNNKKHSNKYPLSTLIKCDCCGRSFRRIYREWKHTTYIRWECWKRNTEGKDACENRTLVDEAGLLIEIKEYLSRIVSSKEKLLEKTISEFKKKYRVSLNELDEAELVAELDRLKKNKDKQTKMFEADIITIDELKERTSDINIAIKRLENELLALHGNVSMYDRIEVIVKKYCGSINDVLNTENLDNEMLKKVIDKIIVNKDGTIKVYLKLFKDLEIDT